MMTIDLASLNSPLVIAVQNNEGILVPIQGLDEFLYGEKDLRILCTLYGRNLFDILYDDHGMIYYEDNKLALKYVLLNDTNNTLMNVIGRIAESVIVRRCLQYPNINIKWLRLASGKQVQQHTASLFRAVGTGFKSTLKEFPQAYNPNDTQRDIIWLDKDGNHYKMAGGTANMGKDAGLQVKVSSNGMRYVYRSVLESMYEVPVVYFDLCDDFGLVYRKLNEEIHSKGYNSIDIQEWFISGREWDEDAFTEIKYYTDLVEALMRRKISVDNLLNVGERYPSFGSAVMAGALDNISKELYLEPSD